MLCIYLRFNVIIMIQPEISCTNIIFKMQNISAPTAEECPAIISKAGVSEAFGINVAHAVHSLTLEDIRYFFKEDATEDNGIPTGKLTLTN